MIRFFCTRVYILLSCLVQRYNSKFFPSPPPPRTINVILLTEKLWFFFLLGNIITIDVSAANVPRNRCKYISVRLLLSINHTRVQRVRENWLVKRAFELRETSPSAIRNETTRKCNVTRCALIQKYYECVITLNKNEGGNWRIERVTYNSLIIKTRFCNPTFLNR